MFGDRWSLLVLRDIVFGDRRYFRELQANSIEGIASNILADRLTRLVELGLLTREDTRALWQEFMNELRHAPWRRYPTAITERSRASERGLPRCYQLLVAARQSTMSKAPTDAAELSHM